MKVGENGGVPVAVTKLEHPGLDTHRNPTFLPDGRHFLYCAAPANASVAVGSLRAGSIEGGFDRKVLDYASSVAFVNGWLLSVRDRNLIAQRFDPSELTVAGKPVAIAQNIDWYAGRYVGTFGAGAETLVYQHAAQPRRRLLRLDVGDARPVEIGDEAFIASPSVSADGRQAIVARFDPTTNSSDLWRVDLDGGTTARLTFTARGSMDDTALFSPEGERVALTGVDAGGVTRPWIQPTGGGTKDGLLPDSDKDFIYLTDWSRDGKTLLTSPQRRETGQDVEVLHLDGDRKPVPLVHGPSTESAGRFSPNGKWVAYESDESGRPEVYVTSYPAATAKWQLSTEGGSKPIVERRREAALLPCGRPRGCGRGARRRVVLRRHRARRRGPRRSHRRLQRRAQRPHAGRARDRPRQAAADDRPELGAAPEREIDCRIHGARGARAQASRLIT